MLTSHKNNSAVDYQEQLISIMKEMQIPVAVLKPDFNESGKLADFTIIMVNIPAAKSLGIPQEKFAGEKLLTLFPSHKTNGVFTAMKDAYEYADAQTVKLENFKGGPGNNISGDFKLNITRSGEFIVVNWLDNALIHNQDNKIQKLQSSNEELEQFAYVASHDLQEPLRMVTSFTQLLQKRYADKLDADANEFIHYAVDGATRMKELIDHLLIYSRAATRNEELTKVDLNNIIENIIDDFRNQIKEDNVNIKYKDLPGVFSDKSMLTRIFANLISNAIKYRGNKNPEITISASHGNSEWLFSVSDNGIGIDQEYYDKIFLIFKRLHSKSVIPGTGIGLAICKKMVDKLGGKIWVNSEPQKGSTFFFTIPHRDQNGNK